MPRKSNMYSLSVKQWNPHVGCKFQCTYCKPSFQAAVRRFGKNNCRLCYNYEPHTHENRFNQPLPKTSYLQFIFACSTGDVSFATSYLWYQMLRRMKRERDKTFLLQSKNPKVFHKWIDRIPDNVILGTTIETNRSNITKRISKAPAPIDRAQALATLDHPLKMVTIEPIMIFDHGSMLNMVESIKPVMVFVGYDSKNCKLEEPCLTVTKKLCYDIAKRGYTVMLKLLRPAWWEK